MIRKDYRHIVMHYKYVHNVLYMVMYYNTSKYVIDAFFQLSVTYFVCVCVFALLARGLYLLPVGLVSQFCCDLYSRLV